MSSPSSPSEPLYAPSAAPVAPPPLRPATAHPAGPAGASAPTIVTVPDGRLSEAELVARALGHDHGPSPVALYFSPRGRIGRATFWRHGMLALLLLDIVGIALLQIAGVDPELAPMAVYVALLWPALAISIKRWHDIGRSGWFVLVNLVPAIGNLVAIVVNGFVPGTRGENRFGPDPLGSGR